MGDGAGMGLDACWAEEGDAVGADGYFAVDFLAAQLARDMDGVWIVIN